MARKATYEENKDIIKGERWSAKLDGSTCFRCQDLDGEEFHVGEGPQPPIHLGPCRCQRIPIVAGWEEFGLDPKDLPPATKASLDGEVPADISYADWIESQPEHVQNEALGFERAEHLRNGEAGVPDFVDDQGRLLTLGQLRKTLGLDN